MRVCLRDGIKRDIVTKVMTTIPRSLVCNPGLRLTTAFSFEAVILSARDDYKYLEFYC